MKQRFFVGVDPMADKDNLDFAVMSKAEIAQAELESETIWEYLTDYLMQSWFELAISAENLAKLKQMADAMEKELR